MVPGQPARRGPTRVECAAWDTHVPPPGQFAVANAAAPAADLELAVHTAGHAEYPGRSRELAAAFTATRAHILRTALSGR